MTLHDLPLNELLRRAAVEADREKQNDLIQEISQRYDEQDPNLVFDIFKGIDDKDAAWVEAVVGLQAANERMQQMAADALGSYFIFHSQSRRTMARLNNGPIKAAEPRKIPKTGTGS